MVGDTVIPFDGWLISHRASDYWERRTIALVMRDNKIHAVIAIANGLPKWYPWSVDYTVQRCD